MCFEEAVSTLGLTHKYHIHTKLAQYVFRKARYDSVSLSMVDVMAYTTGVIAGVVVTLLVVVLLSLVGGVVAVVVVVVRKRNPFVQSPHIGALK